MDDTQTIDSFVDSLALGMDGEAGSSPEPEVATEGVQAEPEQVAPEQEPAAEVSSDGVVPEVEAVETPVETAPSLDPALAARLEALEAEARAATERANQSEAMIRQAQQVAFQRQEQARLQQQRDEWATRATQIENITDPDLQKREAQRLVAEVEQARMADAQRVVQQRDQFIAQREQEAESTAAIGAGLFQSIQNDPDLSPEKKQQLIENSRYLATYSSPAAQQAAIEREQKIVSLAVARAKAEWEKANTQSTAQKVNNRIASDTDLVGNASGSAGGRPKTIDDFVDSLFG